MVSFNRQTSGIQRFPEPHNYLRSTQPGSFLNTSYTLAKDSHPVEPEATGIGTGKKFLQRGEVLAKITSGADAGKVGVFQLEATDGRQTAANIVGINRTFAPWELNERDVDVAADYTASVVAAWVTIRDASGARIPVTSDVITAMDARTDLNITWK